LVAQVTTVTVAHLTGVVGTLFITNACVLPPGVQEYIDNHQPMSLYVNSVYVAHNDRLFHAVGVVHEKVYILLSAPLAIAILSSDTYTHAHDNATDATGVHAVIVVPDIVNATK
jgi:hypothetical protein